MKNNKNEKSVFFFSLKQSNLGALNWGARARCVV